MSRQFKHEESQEISLMFDLLRVYELKTVTAGFGLYYQESSEMVAGMPSAVLLEGGLMPDSLSPISSLTEVSDHGYH